MSAFRRTLIPAAAVAVLAAALAPPAQAVDTRGRCAAKGSKTVKQSRHVRIYEITTRPTGIDETTLYGCLWTRNRPWKLAEAYDDDFVMGYGYRSIRLAGGFVAWNGWSYDISCKADCPPGYDSSDDWVSVADLVTRKGGARDGLPAGSTLKLNRHGATAWLQRLGGGRREVHAWDADGARVLDTGPISSTGFALKSSTLSWVNDGERRSAQLR